MRRAARVAAACVLAALAAGLALYALRRAQAPPNGPVAVAWDRTPCARCGMLIGDPGFAAQLHTREGEVLHFDDPGCLLLYVDEARPAVHALWFHHRSEERWLRGPEAGFARAAGSPMGYDLAAVERAVAELSEAEAFAHAREREAARRAAP